MELVDRIALIVTPRRRFIEWVNRLPEAGTPLTSDDLASLRNVFLVAAGDAMPDLQDLIDTYWEEVFEDFLEGWTYDEALWPLNRTPHVFRDWFQVDCVEGVADADPDEPLFVSERARTRCAMCDEALDEAQLIVGVVGGKPRRLTSDELEALERAEEPADDEALQLVFRCCGSECAARADAALAKAMAGDKELTAEAGDDEP